MEHPHVLIILHYYKNINHHLLTYNNSLNPKQTCIFLQNQPKVVQHHFSNKSFYNKPETLNALTNCLLPQMTSHAYTISILQQNYKSKFITFIARSCNLISTNVSYVQINYYRFQVYMDIVNASIKHQYQISSAQIDKQSSVLIECFLFVARNLIQIGIQKLGFYFCVKAIRLCQVYGKIKQIGQLLFLMGCITRKMQRFQHCIKFLKKSLQYIWRFRTPQTNEKQIQIYSILSQCLLQINQPQQSKIFAYKYEIGYLQKDNSRIIQLSNELIDSVQHRKNKWHVVSKQSMQMLLEFDIQQFMLKNYMHLTKMDQRKILQLIKINFQFLYDNFLTDDMFFYEIPMPLEIVLQDKGNKRKIRQGTKFLIKKSSSVGSIRSQPSVKLLKIQPQKPKQFLIFNYRGIKVSKLKLCQFFNNLLGYLKISLNQSGHQNFNEKNNLINKQKEIEQDQ